MNQKGYVYKFLGESDELLYIGKTKDIKRRINEHMTNGHLSQEQYKKVVSIYYVELASMNDAGLLERYMIAKCKPEFNKEFANEGDCEIKINIPEDSEWILFETRDTFKKYWNEFIKGLNEDVDIFIETEENVYSFCGRTLLQKIPIIEIDILDDENSRRDQIAKVYETLKRMGGSTFFWERSNFVHNAKNIFKNVICVLKNGDVYFGKKLIGNICSLKELDDTSESIITMYIMLSPLKAMAIASDDPIRTIAKRRRMRADAK